MQDLVHVVRENTLLVLSAGKKIVPGVSPGVKRGKMLQL